MKLPIKILLLFLVPVICQAQSRKEAYTIYREAGFTGTPGSYGLHYTWQTQISKKWYLGAGAEALRSFHEAEGVKRRDNVVPLTFRLSTIPHFRGFRLVPFVGAGVVVSQPTGTVLEGGLGMAVGKWQVSAAYRWIETDEQLPSINSGIFFRVSRLLIKPAAQKPAPVATEEK